MVQDLRELGVGDERVLAAMARVARERFLPAELAAKAYTSSPLPIPAGQTISAPYIVAVMTAALELTGTERVLEVGTGSGYGAAILSRCAEQVVTIEYHPELARSAARVLDRLGYHNVEVRLGDGARGAPDRAPFDAISMTAMATGGLPEPLVDQLAPGGRLVGPVGPGPRGGDGELLRLRSNGHLETLMPVRFVPLISEP
jgi:protein-L-isoaspartate(D-aspartate) O-methyltransferase